MIGLCKEHSRNLWNSLIRWSLKIKSRKYWISVIREIYMPQKFVRIRYHDFYSGISNCEIYIQSSLHLTYFVKLLGPLWTHSTFPLKIKCKNFYDTPMQLKIMENKYVVLSWTCKIHKLKKKIAWLVILFIWYAISVEIFPNVSVLS